MAAQPHGVVATNNNSFTFLQSNPRANRGLDFVFLVSKVWSWLTESPNPMKMYPEEAAEILRYQARRDRLRMPHPLEGEAEHARSCFFLRQFGEGVYGTHGEQEFYSINTETGEVTRLAFLAYWRGTPEHYDLEIGTPKP